MESRKIVLMNLFTERHRDWSGGHSQGKKRVGQIQKVSLTCKHYHV